jgi:GNAT superfamily N-acetyltransferase
MIHRPDLDADRARRLRDVTFRVAEARDESLLEEMLYLAVFVPPGESPPAPTIVAQPELKRYVSSWGRQGDDGLIAVAGDGYPIGAAWVRLWSEDDRGYGFVDIETPELSVAVRPEFRGGGLGTRLLEELLRRADENYDSVSLSVSILNPAVGLYARLGFITVSAAGASMTMRRMRPISNGREVVWPRSCAREP